MLVTQIHNDLFLAMAVADINECAEAVDDLCTAEDTVCHNTPGTFKCVPIKKRDVGLSCPPGFKRNVVNQVCDGKFRGWIINNRKVCPSAFDV